MTRDQFVSAALANPANARILEHLHELSLPDAWLVSGAVFQTVWNVLTGRSPEFGIKDYDLFYFDPDTSYDAEDRAIRRTQNALVGLGVAIELRNQARVHLWYEEKFAKPYPPLTRATDGIDRFLMPCAQVGIRRNGNTYDVYAPRGFDDLERMVVRPNLVPNFDIDRFREKALRWQAVWPEVTILDA